MKPVPACRHSAADSTVQLKVWKTPRLSSLPQPRTVAHSVGSGPARPARPPRIPAANPIAASAIRPPKFNAIGALFKYSAVGNTSNITPTLNLNMPGSACAISMVPSGTPARPPIRNGQTSVKSIDRQNVGSVEVCPTMEQIRTRGTATEGGST
jgi:hypothetical protein